MTTSTLKQRVRRAQEDSERMDWLEWQCFSSAQLREIHGVPVNRQTAGWRKAIDLCRAKVSPGRVVHCKKQPFDVYIGRPSKWGNPFSHKRGTAARFLCATRDEAISNYEVWLRNQPELLAATRRELRGKILGCWCKPLACHGDVLARVAEETDEGV